MHKQEQELTPFPTVRTRIFLFRFETIDDEGKDEGREFQFLLVPLDNQREDDEKKCQT